ncbi:MAG: galactose mutarotase [Muribaculaceae bacterium]|nr:galactose mutarotase [Muribaculaceae bacterium]
MNIEQKTVSCSRGEIKEFKITNAGGASVRLSSVGAGIVSICVPDKNGVLQNVALGYKNLEDYFYDGPCAGKVPGRYANRIALGKFCLDGTDYQLRINNGPNALHGGPEGFANKIWDAAVDGEAVVFTLHSPDGDENYPGNLEAKVSYRWSEDNELRIDFSAKTDKATVVNLTNHTYFNLAGENSGTVLNHRMQLMCSHYLPTSDSLIPTGEIAPVAGTPMDFTELKELGKDIKQDFPALNYGKGYDNCWVVDDYRKGVLKQVATLRDEDSGRELAVFTTQPAAQVYTGNWLAGSPKNESGRSYNDYDGVAIECQGMPDAPNHPNFPSQVLRPGEEYNQTIIFKFRTF